MNQPRYRTEWGRGELSNRIVVSRQPRTLFLDAPRKDVELDAMLEQAIADDLTNNNGKMFGHDSLKFYTMLMTYPEYWSCVGVEDGNGILERTPTHPHQAVVRYRYMPSAGYGGSELQDRPRFYVVDRGEYVR